MAEPIYADNEPQPTPNIYPYLNDDMAAVEAAIQSDIEFQRSLDVGRPGTGTEVLDYFMYEEAQIMKRGTPFEINVALSGGSACFVSVGEGGYMPTLAHPLDAGWDIYASKNITVPANSSVFVPTALTLTPPPMFFAFLTSRSSMSKKNLFAVAGVIDAGFTGPLGVQIMNFNPTSYDVLKGDKIAQVVFLPVPRIVMLLTDELPPSVRGTKGFGSSGR